MNTKLYPFIALLALALGLGALIAREHNDSPPKASEDAVAELLQQNQQLLENQKKILEKLDKLQEDMAFVKAKTGRL